MTQVLTLFIFGLLFSGCQQKQLYKDTRLMMGTFVEVVSPDQRALPIVFDEIKRIEKLLSKYDPQSEISRLNAAGKLKVSPETYYVMEKSRDFWEASQGAFDITVAPLVKLWGFRDKDYKVPDKKQIGKLLALTGTDKIIFHKADNVIEFNTSGTQVDLGAIGKGYAIDCAVIKLKEQRISSCLINTGGQVYALGDKLGSPWKVAIQNPRGNGASGSLLLKDQSVSTSGDYEQYFLKNKKRYSHIIDPKTGYPVDNGIVSVTVIASNGLIADALSTSVFVLGREKGEQLAKNYPGVTLKITEEKDVQNN